MICHPDFDVKGAAGVQAAQEYAKNLSEGVQMTLQQAGDVKQNPEIGKLRRYLKGFEYKIRIVPGEML